MARHGLDFRYPALILGLFSFVTSDSATLGVERLNGLRVIEHCKRKALVYRARPLIDYSKGTYMPGRFGVFLVKVTYLLMRLEGRACDKTTCVIKSIFSTNTFR